MKADLATLRLEALAVAQTTPAAAEIEDITLETGEDNDGWEFLRVIVQLKLEAQPSDDQLLALQDALHERLIDLDDRFPSVRFPNAA